MVQLNVAPETELVRAILVAVALHIVSGLADVTSGVGLTVTIMFEVIPGHEFAVGVTIYVTVPAVEPGLVRTCDMVAPPAGAAPVIPPVIAPMVQLNVAPDTLLFSAMFVLVALQIVVDPVYVTLGVGLTVTMKSTGVPEHELAVGVTL
jgi:hypothetical protein